MLHSNVKMVTFPVYSHITILKIYTMYLVIDLCGNKES